MVSHLKMIGLKLHPGVDVDLLVPDVEDEAVATEAHNGNEAIDQGTQEDNAIAGNLELGPVTRNYLEYK